MGSADGTFENSGTVDKVKGSAANTLDLTLQNKAGGKVNHNGGRINWTNMTSAGFYYLQGGTVTVAAGNTAVNEVGGIFTGGNSEVIADRFVNAGTLYVNEDSYFGDTDSDPLTLTVTGDFENSGTVSLEWRTTQTIDPVAVSGTAYLGGPLSLSATPGMPYGPYVILTYAERVGEFAAVTLDFNEYELDYDVTSAYVLHVGPPPDDGGA